jgi:hypothetical protein
VIHQFGGPVTTLDRASGVKLAVRVFGELDADCDAATAVRMRSVILETITRLADESPSAAKLCMDPSAFPTTIEPAIAQALSQRGLPAARFGNFNLGLSSETIDELKAAAAAARGRPPSIPPPIAIGTTVLVQWSDGNRYPGQVRAVGNGQFQVGFPDGQVHWIAAAYVAPATG